MLQVKISDGSDGLPKGWPTECVECPDGEALRPGYDHVWTPQQLKASQKALRAEYAEVERLQVRAARQAEKDAEEQAEIDQIQFKLIFRLMNEVRVLKGEPELTKRAFRLLVQEAK